MSFTHAAAAIGGFYVADSCLLILTLRKWAAALAIVLLVADVAGRIALVVAGLYPLNSIEQTFAVVVGTLIAIGFGIFIAMPPCTRFAYRMMWIDLYRRLWAST